MNPVPIRSLGACIPPCTAVDCGPCGSSWIRFGGRHQPQLKYLLENAKGTKANTDSRPPSTFPRSWAAIRTIRCPPVKSAGAASRSTPSKTCIASTPTSPSARSPWSDHQRPACVIWAMYLGVAREQGIDWKDSGGPPERPYKEFHSQNEFICPPEASVKLVVDTIEYAARHLPQWNSGRSQGYASARRGRPRPRSWPSRSATGWSTSRRR